MAGFMDVAPTIEDERQAEREILRKRQRAGMQAGAAGSDGADLECLGGAKMRGRWGSGDASPVSGSSGSSSSASSSSSTSESQAVSGTREDANSSL